MLHDAQLINFTTYVPNHNHHHSQSPSILKAINFGAKQIREKCNVLTLLCCVVLVKGNEFYPTRTLNKLLEWFKDIKKWWKHVIQILNTITHFATTMRHHMHDRVLKALQCLVT